MEELNLFIKSIFIDNMIFAYFLGMCSFLAVSKNVKTALGLGIAVTFMLVVTIPINYLLDKYVLQYTNNYNNWALAESRNRSYPRSLHP